MTERNATSSIYAILRGMIREEIDATPGWRELTAENVFPSCVHAETAILGAIMLDNAAYGEAKALLPDDFSLDSNRLIFLRMSELIDAGTQVDIVTLSNTLAEHKQAEIREIELVGGVAYLASLTEGLPRRPHILTYVKIVKANSLLRRLIGVCSSALNQAYSGESGWTIIEVLEGNIAEIKTEAKKGIRQ